MTPKEVLYVDDALGHIQFTITQAEEACKNLQDAQLRENAQQLVKVNQKLFSQFLQLL